MRLDHVAISAGSSIHFDASLNTPFGESGRFLNFATPGSIWDGATAFRNVAPNSYVIRTNWTDIDGFGRELTGEGDVGELWTTGSSVGPTVDGRIGVDVSAPGDRIVAAYASRSYWASLRYLLIEDGGRLYGMAGAVSAAAPVVTGIIALMLEVDPTLDADSVKCILQETARTDEFTGQTPNTMWGYGKVDAFEALMAVRLLNTTPAVGTLPDRKLYVGAGAVAVVVPVAGAFRNASTYQASSSAPGVATVTVSGSQVTVTAVTAGVATITVTATGADNSVATQRFAVTVLAATTFSDPLVPGTTPPRAIHFLELRTRVAALRSREGLPSVRWTDPVLTVGVTPVKRVHLTELRAALDAAYEAAGRPRPTYTDSIVTAGVTAIKAVHVVELRNAIVALE